MTENEFDYKKYLQMIYKKKVLFIITALSVMVIAVIISFKLPRIYEAKSTIFIEKNVISDLVSGMALNPSVENEIRFLNASMTSRSLLMKVFDDLNMKVDRQNPASMEGLINSFKGSTKIVTEGAVEGSSESKGLFIVSFQGNNPKFVAEYINALVRRYVEENVLAKREASSGASQFFSGQIQDYGEQFKKAEDELNEFKRTHATLINEDEGAVLGEISNLKQQLASLRGKRAQLEGLRGISKRGNPLHDRLVSLQRRLGELQVQYTDNYPEVIKVKEEIEEIKAQLRSGRGENLPVSDPKELGRVEMELKGIRVEEANLSRLLASKQSLFSGIPTAKANLAKLERERNARETTYQELVSRQNKSEFTSQVQIQQKAMTFRVVDPAVVPTKPISPDRVKIISLGILAGLTLGVLLVLLLDFLDRSVKTVNTLKTLGLPILAVIPRIENEQVFLRKKEEDIRIYTIAGICFSFILVVLLLEALKLPYLDYFVDNIQAMNPMANIKNTIKNIF